ncbi:MAG: cupin domain-containing protein [Sandaracinus sp.]
MAQRSARQYDFESILHPISKKQFFEDYWEKKPLLIRRKDRAYYGDLLTLEALDRVITSNTLTNSNAFIANARNPVDAKAYTFPDGVVDLARLYQQFADGGTIGFNQLHTFVPRLHDFCRSLERELSCRFQTNIYMTPPGSQGFPPHYDSHDVFILQVHGTKHWQIFDTPIELPFRGQSFKRAETPVGAVTMEFDLEPGDMFYLPRGIMHDAQTREGETLHITVGALQTTWTEAVLEAVAKMALSDLEMRRSLPPGYARTEFDRTEARAKFKEMFRRLAERADADAALDHFADDLVSSRTALLEGQLMQVLGLSKLSLDDRVGARPNLLYRYREKDGQFIVSCYGAEMRLPAYAAEPTRYALETASFAVRDLPGDLDDEGKLVLIKRLVREGMVHKLA